MLGTRVLLNVIIVAYQAGVMLEDIAQQFPHVALPDVYLIIAHYLTRTTENGAYLYRGQTEAAGFQCAIETSFDPARTRLLARQRRALTKNPTRVSISVGCTPTHGFPRACSRR